LRHVADAEDKNAKPDQRDHHQHRGGDRIEHPTDAKSVLAEGEPGEILNGAELARLQRLRKREDRQCERYDLASDCKSRRTFTSRIRQTQNHQRNGERHRWNQPEIVDEPIHGTITIRSARLRKPSARQASSSTRSAFIL